MIDETRNQVRAATLCVIAFLVGCVLAFSGGCAASNTVKTKAFGEQFDLGAGVYLNEDID